MKKKIRYWILPCILALLTVTVIAFYRMPWGFAREVSDREKAVRMEVVHTAESWLGTKENSERHRQIIDIYNAHTPLARGYAVTYEDAWCAAFDSAVAITCGLTDIIPTECGCTPQIRLFQELDSWVEEDDYVPLPGDIIYYHWHCLEIEDCKKSANHVGIVVGTVGPLIKVIEGNKNNDVSYRITWAGAPSIRGYGVPNYTT